MSLKETKNSWSGMWKRCGGKHQTTQGCKNYKDKGITVDPYWEDFDNFLSDMGLRPNGLTLDRIDNTKGYYKENCRWATPKTQTRNRSTTRTVMFEGKAWFIQDLAEHLGLRYDTLWRRLKADWSEEELRQAVNRNNNSDKRVDQYYRNLEYNGKHYTTSELAMELEVSSTMLRDYFRQGKSLDEIITIVKKYKENTVTHLNYQGKRYTVRELATLLNVDRTTLVRRATKLNWSEDRWGLQSNKGTRTVEYQGKIWLIADLARHLRVNYKTLTDRIFRLNWSEDRWHI